ncbi:hypothetical protein SPF06_15180 [Sinomonas sp. JGH33]|uniref:ABC transporter permease n=1 Tax=Sinomonas terricola TaxID=3110330 RepID=A0ABU5T8Q7_9MICC|nr:hypothetical protein [Sinomonas sp. JGH33]MEA5456077.1 hypothetical protein [Sinomonas sp. JGH33]
MKWTFAPVSRAGWVAIHVEARKLIDTRSARWLQLVMASVGLVLIALAIGLTSARSATLELSVVLAGLALPGAVIAPLLAILAITSDWQHKDVVKFYAVQPKRSVILAAKYIAVTVFAVAVVLVDCVIALLVATVFSWAANVPLVYGAYGSSLWQVVCSVVVGSVSGAAVASALMSTPVAIVFVLAQSTVLDLLIGFIPNIPAAYLQSGTFSSFLSEGGEVIPAVSSALIWIVVPALIGAWRHAKRDVV